MNLKQIVKGNLSKKQEAIYLSSILTLFFLSLIFSQIFFPGGYSILEYYISDQGYFTKNPDGAWFFVIGVALTAILLIPHFLYIHKNLMPDLSLFVRLISLLNFSGSIGLFLVAVITKDFKKPHDIAADIAFGSFVFSMLLMLIYFIIRIGMKKSWPDVKHFLILYGLIIIGGIVMSFMDDSQLTQWSLLFMVLFWIIGSFIVIPEKKKEIEN